MVTISCLIVVATLFSQLNTTMPTSAEPKAVDIFFFYYITRLFIVGIHHSFLYMRTFRADARREIELHGDQYLHTDDGQTIFDDWSQDTARETCVHVKSGSAKHEAGGSVAIKNSWFDPTNPKKNLILNKPKPKCTFDFVFSDLNVTLYLSVLDWVLISVYIGYIVQGRIEIQKYFWTH